MQSAHTQTHGRTQATSKIEDNEDNDNADDTATRNRCSSTPGRVTPAPLDPLTARYCTPSHSSPTHTTVRLHVFVVQPFVDWWWWLMLLIGWCQPWCRLRDDPALGYRRLRGKGRGGVDPQHLRLKMIPTLHSQFVYPSR